MFTWKLIDEKYLDYLRVNGDSRIPYSNYGINKFKPFFGELFTVGNLVYVTQVSHPQPRHEKLTEQIDFLKLYDPISNKLIAVVNLNFMFPTPKESLSDLNYRKIDVVRHFQTPIEQSKYIDLLKLEMRIINLRPVTKNSLEIYRNRYTNPESKVSKRCLDFKLLEQVATCYSADNI